ncbi:UDP-glucosyltransferase 2-like [Pectinophora gossypiella]|uniref:UDP-glucosyltransferase 2-like n=1 Tax=Pectinophora gossypiella TaxID=13191 RepID=UPI00214F38FC|nr:UDP-glucosyltransferase 2-like [Pectinophora gossypiella]XP_049885626.1 UDP-glucosyltransferase 2-like [Pectinophora gossypiella]
MRWSPAVCLAVVAIASIGEAAKILILFPFPGRSHGILGEAFVRLLSDAKHEVTYVTTFPIENPPPNVRQVDVNSNLDLQKAAMAPMMNITAIMNKEINIGDMTAMFNLILSIGRSTLENENMKKFINDPNEKYDLIIIEWMFTELYTGLSALFECPYIWFSSIEPHWSVLKLIDEHLNPAYNPDGLFSGEVPPFSFIVRVKELLSQVVGTLIREYYSLPLEKKDYEKIFGPIFEKRGKVLPPYEELRFNGSLMLGNSHVSLGQATRIPQNFKPIGGYHINPKLKPLPDDLKKIMDGAKNGVIYFSMGSNLKSKDMPDQMKKDLLKMFGTLKYTVIWKFEDVLLNIPKNVRILQWAPQPSIIAHPNCVLFITHGGLLSTTEAIHYGKPIIGIPVFGDQPMNVDRAVHKGIAKRVDLTNKLPEDLKVAIEEILGDPKYSQTVKELSMIYHDRPATPGAELVHWVEHVVRTRGAPHLRSPALHVPWYQKMYLDLAGLIIVSLMLLKHIIRRLCCSKNKNKKATSEKKNK